MKKGYVFVLAIAVVLTFGFTIQAQAGPKVNVVFQKLPGVDIQGNVTITDLQTGESHTIDWHSTSIATFANIQSGYGPVLFRFEWVPGVVPAQVQDVWVDVPDGAAGSTQYHYLPAHNVTFTNAGTYNNLIEIGAFSSRTAGAALTDARPGNRNLGVTIANNLHPWNGPVTVPMLDGCYTIFAYYGSCPGTTSQCHTVTAKDPVCVGGPLDPASNPPLTAAPINQLSF